MRLRSKYLDQIGVPGIATDVQVIVGRFLASWLAEDVSWMLMSARWVRLQELGAGGGGHTILRRAHKASCHSCSCAGVDYSVEVGLSRGRGEWNRGGRGGEIE